MQSTFFGFILFVVVAQEVKPQTDDVNHRLAMMEAVIADHGDRVATLEQQNLELRAKVEYCSDESSKIHTPSVSPDEVITSPETFSQFTSIGCVSDVITLSCPAGRTIFATSGYYGQYASTCDAACCPPNPLDDCTELVEENRPEDWIAIKYLCDNQTSCEYENGGSPIDECQEGYIADYLQIFYDCLPHDVSTPVGFSAWANTGSTTVYASGDVIVYNAVISNIGGHYNPETSSFICPSAGVFVFSVTLQATSNDRIDVQIFRNSVGLVYAMAFSASSEQKYPATSSLVVAECAAGDVVWVRCIVGGNLWGVSVSNVFSGFLLQVY